MEDDFNIITCKKPSKIDIPKKNKTKKKKIHFIKTEKNKKPEPHSPKKYHNDTIKNINDGNFDVDNLPDKEFELPLEDKDDDGDDKKSHKKIKKPRIVDFVEPEKDDELLTPEPLQEEEEDEMPKKPKKSKSKQCCAAKNHTKPITVPEYLDTRKIYDNLDLTPKPVVPPPIPKDTTKGPVPDTKPTPPKLPVSTPPKTETKPKPKPKPPKPIKEKKKKPEKPKDKKPAPEPKKKEPKKEKSTKPPSPAIKPQPTSPQSPPAAPSSPQSPTTDPPKKDDDSEEEDYKIIKSTVNKHVPLERRPEHDGKMGKISYHKLTFRPFKEAFKKISTDNSCEEESLKMAKGLTKKLRKIVIKK